MLEYCLAEVKCDRDLAAAVGIRSYCLPKSRKPNILTNESPMVGTVIVILQKEAFSDSLVLVVLLRGTKA